MIYYVDATNGTDDGPGTQAQPWRTIAKVNGASFAPGDSVLFKRGETWNDAILEVDSIGSMDHLILYDAYGSGAKPRLSRRINVTGDYNTVQNIEVNTASEISGIDVTGSHNLIQFNEIHSTLEDGIHPYGSHNTFRGNYIHDLNTGTVPHCDFFQCEGPASHLLFENNLCVSTETTGIRQIAMFESPGGVIDDIVFRNNIFVMGVPADSPMNFHRHIETGEKVISNITVIHNTFYHIASAWQDMGKEAILLGDITAAVVKNNLIINYGDSTHSYVGVHGTTTVDCDYNCVYKITGSIPLGQRPHDVWMTDPKVVSLMSRDFHLQAASPCRSAGATGLDVPTDYDSRLRGVQPSIGALEYIGDTMPITTDLQAVETFLRNKAAAVAQEAALFTAQADAVAAAIVALQGLDAQLNTAATVIE